MNTQKFLVSGIAGGVAAFFAGYLIYGMLLMDFMRTNAGTASGVMRNDADLIWWALIVGSLFNGLFVSYIFNKWANINSLSQGVTAGAVIFFLTTASFDFTMYATSNVSNLKATIVDIIAMAVMGAIIGAVVGLVNGMSKK